MDIKHTVIKLIHRNEKVNWERDVREVYTHNGMSLIEGDTTWESEVIEVPKIYISPNGQSSLTKCRILSNDQDGTCTEDTKGTKELPYYK